MLCSSTMMASVTVLPPTRPIPGSYGLPLLGLLRDRLDNFWFQGPETFFRSRMASHNSTVFRTNMPSTFPFFLGIDPRVICLLDCASFSSLFDLSLVQKKNILIDDYMPSLNFTGNTRVVIYQDPSEPAHSRVKSFCWKFYLLELGWQPKDPSGPGKTNRKDREKKNKKFLIKLLQNSQMKIQLPDLHKS